MQRLAHLPSLRRGWQFWIDRGGTFTDIVARPPQGGLVVKKLLSQDPGYEDAALAGVRAILGLPPQAPIPAHAIEAVKMGTTVGTNTLLERKGARVALVVTEGFGDALAIGDQSRPELFALAIRLPEVLYEEVVEVKERVGAKGEEVIPLDREGTRLALERLHQKGIDSLAVALLHSYRYPHHEIEIAGIARQIGFEHVTLSHEASPLMGFVGRGETAVVDAYLSPLLVRYIEALEGGFEGHPKLFFMQSSGGLTEASAFRGKDSLLSGPAGGIVGAAKTAARAGFSRIISFDMGGTSTDVAHFDGEFERRRELAIGGVRVRVPMLHIHTVAAGGGSILRFSQGRYQVGPDSAGADPGPACYRKGGPLTVTDANVMLGRIPIERFPKVFGPSGDLPPDREAAVRGFEALARTIAEETGREVTAEAVAEGFLEVAVEHMAQAIRRISSEQGRDVTRYALCCFGGAGGQHACKVAEALDIPTVFLHPLAGVLSAYGMGLADQQAIRSRFVEAPLEPDLFSSLKMDLEELAMEAKALLIQQGAEEGGIRLRFFAYLRYGGTDTPLEVPADDLEGLQRAFEERHRRRFGFLMEGRRVWVESLAAEAIAPGEAVEDLPSRGKEDMPVSRVPLHVQGGWREVPLYHRESLSPGTLIQGPAIVAESTATTVIEAGWQGEITPRGDLVLTRRMRIPRPRPRDKRPHPLWLELFNRRFMAIAERMGDALRNTAHSVNIKERLDFSCAVFDGEGGLVANAPHIPVHLGSMGESVKAAARFDLKPGDGVILNSPYHGGTHLPDITAVTPVFMEGRLAFFVASRGHHADVGGITPGSMPHDSSRLEQEGVWTAGFKAVEGGRFLQERVGAWLTSGPYPARNPDQNLADLRAQLAANQRGVEELVGLVEEFGLDTVLAYTRHVQDNAEAAVRRLLPRLKGGSFACEMDDGTRIQVAVTIDKVRGEAVIDFTGTSPQHPGNLNAPLAVTKAVVLYVFRTLVDEPIPLNAGCLKPLRIVVPQGSLLNPAYPAAVAAGNVETSQHIADALLAALGVMAACQGTMNNLSFGDERLQYYETLCGGAGAGRGFDGASAVHTHMTNSRLTDVEVLEHRFPVRVERFAIRRGSGGRGRWRGGDGVERRLRFLAPMAATLLTSRRRIPPFGLGGGEAALCGRNLILRRDGSVERLPGRVSLEVEAGEALVIETPGGGGFGDVL